MKGGLHGMIEAMGRFIDQLSAFVFMKVPFFGTQIELVVLALGSAMIFFTLWLGIPQLRGVGIGLQLIRGRHADDSAPGTVSQFQALSTALSGTIGLGNIGGVAIAIALGGPGAAFWMFVIGFFAMALKAAEVTLGLMYREFSASGEVRGGPMYTLKNGLARLGLPKTGRSLGGLYAFFALGGALPLLQVNQSFSQLSVIAGIDSGPGNGLIYGVMLTIAVGVVVIGGVRSIANVAARLVPLMCLIYLGGGIVILAVNAGAIPAALETIIRTAFAPDAVVGGAIGSFVVGMRRAVFSCEAGVGSAVIAHSAAKTHHPASEGMVALIEPLLDTMVVCTMTALIIVVTGVYDDGYKDIAMTSAAFGTVTSWFPYVLSAAVFLFAFSTLISWGYYGLQAWGYLFGHSRTSEIVFKLLYCLLQPIGAVLSPGKVIDLIDSLFFLMVLPNLIGLALLAVPVRREMSGFLAGVKAGTIYGKGIDDETAQPRHD
jgi:AGCS family alanine or glycine:cation symporter